MLPVVVARSSLQAVVLLGAIAGGAVEGGLGPGPLPWTLKAPESVGLDSRKLAAAAAKVGKIDQRWCFLVVHNGSLVWEEYFNNETLSNKHETDSAGKTAVALAIGAALTAAGLAENTTVLDTPIESFGVNTSIFNTSRGDWSKVVTMRHLLSQASGVGYEQPGTAFTYDSDDYIQLLSPALAKITGQPPINVTTDRFATPLGVPDLFLHDDYIGGGNISSGGGQEMSCRALARVGQLIVNQGQWLDTKGNPYQLVSKKFMEEAGQSSFPEAFTTYGFLQWLNKPGSSPAFCCAPRWCEDTTSDRYQVGGKDVMWGIVGDNFIPSKAPTDLSIAYGHMLNLMVASPTTSTVVVTMGRTYGESLWCGGRSYDEAFGLSALWEYWGESLIPNASIAEMWAAKETSNSHASAASAAKSHELTSKNEFMSSAAHSPNITGSGACFCQCPPEEGYGTCFDLSPTAVTPREMDYTDPNMPPQCASFSTDIQQCPIAGMMRQCGIDDGVEPTCDGPTIQMRMPGMECAPRSDNLRCSNGSQSWDNQTCRGHPSLEFQMCQCVPKQFYKCTYYPANTCSEIPDIFPRSQLYSTSPRWKHRRSQGQRHPFDFLRELEGKIV